jgi:enoyl-CoA hydratase/carnithine racemase
LLDDDTPEVLTDLKAAGFAIEHIRNVSEKSFSLIETGLYDLLLLDYGGIGHRMGADEGLDVLRHLRRVSPALRIVAFTGRTFDASKADFFRMCDHVLKKDAGIRETTEAIERELAIALTPAHQWKALLLLLGIAPGSSDALALEKAAHRAARSSRLMRFGGAATKLGVDAAAAKLLEYLASAVIG